MIHHPTSYNPSDHYGVSTNAVMHGTILVQLHEDGHNVCQSQQARIVISVDEALHLIELLTEAVEKIKENQ